MWGRVIGDLFDREKRRDGHLGLGHHASWPNGEGLYSPYCRVSIGILSRSSAGLSVIDSALTIWNMHEWRLFHAQAYKISP